MWQVGDKLGRFRLDREIGQGSHGVVWIATDTALDAPVAVKILHPWLTQDTAVRDRFKRELLLARRIAHPGVCRLFDLHEEGDAFFITMDYVEGQTLLNILKNEGRLEPLRATRILRGVCQALAAAHNAGVIHRDLKPANIIVRGGDNPMILDFGTATASDVSRVTRPGTAVGSMRFIAPEIFTGVAPSVRTDIYSLGVVAYVTLAGKLPYNAAAGAIEMLEMIRNQPPQRIDIIQPDVPARLADVIAKTMEKNPDARFPSAQAFEEALAEVEMMYGGDATKVTPPSKSPSGQNGAAKAVSGPTAAAPGPSSTSGPSARAPGPSGEVSRTSTSAATVVARPASLGGGMPPVPLTNSNVGMGDSPVTVANATQAAQTVVDGRSPDLSLGTHVPQASMSGELPLLTGSHIVEGAGGFAPKTDESPRQGSITDPSENPLPPEMTQTGKSALQDAAGAVVAALADDANFFDAKPTLAPAEEHPLRPLEPTVRVARVDLEMAEKERRGEKGVDKRVVIAAVAGVVVLVAAIAIAKGMSSSGSEDAGVLASNDDAGVNVIAPPPVVDAGTAVVDAGQAEPVADGGTGGGEGGGFDFGLDAGPDVEPDPGPGPHPTRPKGDPKIDATILAARKMMAQKGILPADVPTIETNLEKAHFLNVKGKKGDAEKLATAAKSSLDGQSVDRAFVMTKLGRFNKAYDKSKRPDIADKVEPLARQAATAFAAGKFEEANKTLNRAFGLVAKPK